MFCLAYHRLSVRRLARTYPNITRPILEDSCDWEIAGGLTLQFASKGPHKGIEGMG